MRLPPPSLRKVLDRLQGLHHGLALVALIACSAPSWSQQPLFTFVQTSDSQPQSSAEWQRFEDVLEVIATGGQPGALLPKKPAFVLFAGDLTWGGQDAEFIQWKSVTDAWLTANGIALLSAPGNHDVDGGDIVNYEQHIATAGVWDVGSAAFTGHNGVAVSTGWEGLRFIGFNNSNPSWNRITAGDLVQIQARVDAAGAANENAFLLCHHPHNENSRVPLANILPDPPVVGYMHGHQSTPRVVKGLSGITNPNVWEVNTNAIVNDRDLVYFEAFTNAVKAYVVILDDNPTQLPAAKTIALVDPLRPLGAPDYGIDGLSTAGARALPSGEAPEQKLWFNAGSWWGVLWSDATSTYRIHRLNSANQAWIDTGTVVSSNADRSFEALPVSSSLYVASNLPSVPSQTSSSQPGQLSRFVYDDANNKYVLASGYPVTINGVRSETLSIARDTSPALWATWTHNASVFVTHTQSGNDASWVAPYALPFASATGLNAEDTSALVSFGGKLGVLWSNGPAGAVYCAVRNDGAGDLVWTLETALSVASLVGDQIDVATSAGVVYALVRSSSGAVHLLTRSTAGAWSTREVAKSSDGFVDPILVVDDTHARLRVFATAPTLDGMSVAGGGTIFQKTATLSGAFPLGKGSPFVQDGVVPALGRATSSQQVVTSASDLVVLASNADTLAYWHAFDGLSTAPSAPVANFTGAPLAGVAPLSVQFTDQSSGAVNWEPTHWLWEFGDGQTSNERHPLHTYANAGNYTVRLTASSGGGSSVLQRTNYVVAGAPPPSMTFTSIADTKVNEASPTTNYGSDTTIRAKTQAGSSYQSFLRFDISSLAGGVVSAKLRLFCTDDSNVGGSIYVVASGWTEGGTNWNNKPALPPNAVTSIGGIAANTWAEFNVTSAVSGPGILDFGLGAATTNSVLYSSREGAHPPQLVIETSGGGPVTTEANFSATPVSGAAPLTVAFTDLSTGAPTSWSWAFGDGGTSTQRNPTHVYTASGSYDVTLGVAGPGGADSLTRPGFISATAPSPSNRLFPIADARVNESSPNSNAGLDTTLRAKFQAGSSYQSFLKFDLSGVSGSVSSAKLRLFVTDESNSGGSIYLVSGNAWTETGITWANRPALPASPLATRGAVALSTWVEFDLGTGTIPSGGLVTLALAGGSSNSVLYTSREGVNKPELIVEAGPPVAPVAEFSATPTSGPAALSVAFTDLSSGAPTTWAWTFGDGGSASTKNPTHVYTSPGNYSVTLVVSNSIGQSSITKTGLVNVTTAPPIVTFVPVADARVNEGSPNSNAGSDAALRVRSAAGGSYHSYLRFDVPALSGAVVSAKLRCFYTDGSDVAGLVFPTSGSWTEAGLNWANKPPASGAQITSVGTVANNAWAEFDVTSAVGGPGTFDFLMTSTSSNSAYFSSREGANPPQLVITTAGP